MVDFAAPPARPDAGQSTDFTYVIRPRSGATPAGLFQIPVQTGGVLPSLATVATTGNYADLINKPAILTPPTLASVATTGNYTDLSHIPALAPVALSGNYADLLNKPASGNVTVGTTAGTVAAGNDSRIVGAAQTSSLATVATSGSYNDLTNKPATSAPPGVTIRTVTAAGPVTVQASDAGGFLVINKTVGEPTVVNLLDGVRVTIKDGKGDAATNPITLTPPANGAIDGQPTKVMDSAYDALGVLSYGGGKFGLY